jgi:hypothetical protein
VCNENSPSRDAAGFSSSGMIGMFQCRLISSVTNDPLLP